MTPGSEPTWVASALWWSVYPLGFTGADTTGADRHRGRGLDGISEWLDYAADLGATGIALGPIFESSSHGYDTVDHYRVDARLGDDSAFDRFVGAAHDRRLRVMLDGVFNHVGRAFPMFERAVAGGPGTPEARWFRLTWPQDGNDVPAYATFEGHADLVALDHDAPVVVDYVADVMCHWLGRGADGWRLDAAYAVPAAFWAKVLPGVRAAFPDAYFVGEVIHGDYTEIVKTSHLDAVTQYELWKAIWSGLNDRNFFELAWALDRHNRYLGTFCPLTFVGNHDVTRLASRLADGRHLAHAIVVLLTTGGTPTIYYGDERGFGGVKEDRAGGDDAIRPPFPAAPANLGASARASYQLHQELISLRRQHSWLHTARTQVVSLANQQFVYTTSAGGHCLTVALNVAESELSHNLDGTERRIIAGAAGADLDYGRLTVPPHGWAITD